MLGYQGQPLRQCLLKKTQGRRGRASGPIATGLPLSGGCFRQPGNLAFALYPPNPGDSETQTASSGGN